MSAAPDSPAPGPFAAADPRSRLLAATVAVVAERGYAAADPALIATRAGVPAPSFHRYFAAPEAAALAAYDCAVDWLGENLKLAATGGDLDWPRRVRATVEKALDLLAPRPDFARFCAWDFPRSGRAALARHQGTVRRLGVGLRRGRASCPWAGQLPAQAEETAIGGALWLVGLRARRGALNPALLAPEIAYFLLVPYLGQTEAVRVAARAQPAAPR